MSTNLTLCMDTVQTLAKAMMNIDEANEGDENVVKTYEARARAILNATNRQISLNFVTQAALTEALKNVPTAMTEDDIKGQVAKMLEEADGKVLEQARGEIAMAIEAMPKSPSLTREEIQEIAAASVAAIVAAKITEALTARGTTHLSEARVREIVAAEVLGQIQDGLSEDRVRELIREHAPRPATPVTKTVVASSTWVAAIGLLLGLIAIILVLISGGQSSSPTPTPPAPAATSAATPAPTPTPSPAPGPVLVDLDPNYVLQCNSNVVQGNGTFNVGQCPDGKHYNCKKVVAPAVAEDCQEIAHPVCATMSDGNGNIQTVLCP